MSSVYLVSNSENEIVFKSSTVARLFFVLIKFILKANVVGLQ